MRKKLLSAVLSLVLLLSLVPTVAHASTDEMTADAYALYQLGLFNGTGKDAQGNPIFDLDRTPTRYEAVTLLVRLLGRTTEAESKEWDTPFTDLTADWARPYVGYAYANKLTSGTSSTTYGGTGNATVSQYITFVLRALGYESGVDFQWDEAWELSDKLGITNGQYNSTTHFTRGDVVIISFNALSAKIKNKDTTLFEDLTTRRVVKEHTHNYVTQTVEHTEERLIGTETVNDYAQVTIYGCNACDFTTYDSDEMIRHVDARYAPITSKCWCSTWWWKTTTEVVGTHEEPKYATRWVSELVRVCSICGQQEP